MMTRRVELLFQIHRSLRVMHIATKTSFAYSTLYRTEGWYRLGELRIQYSTVGRWSRTR